MSLVQCLSQKGMKILYRFTGAYNYMDYYTRESFPKFLHNKPAFHN